MLSVQALENTNETTKQTKPSNLERLEKTVDEKNTFVVSAGTVLQGADTERENAKLKLNDAREKRNQNLETMTKSADTVDNALAKEIKSRAQTVMDLQQNLSDQNKQKDEFTKAIADKQAQLDEAQAKFDEAQKELDAQKEQNKDVLDKLEQASKEKAQYEETLKDLNEQLTSLNTQIEETNTKLEEASAKLEENKNNLEQISQEKTDLESQLATEKAQLDSLKDQLNNQAPDEEIQQYKDLIDSTQAKIDADTARIAELDEEYNDAYSKMKEQEQVLTTATNNRTQIMNEVDTINHEYFDTMDELEFAQKNYDNLQKIVYDLNNGIDTAELTQLKTELSNLQVQQTELETTVADLTKQLKEAEDELSNAYIKYNDNVVSFYKEIYRETGSLDAYYAFTELEKYDGVEFTGESTFSGNTGTTSIYDSKNYDKTCASLTDLKEAINYIKMCNAIREYEGVAPLKVSYYLMAVSAIQNEYSSVTIDHSRKYNVGENLYWRTGDYKSKDFLNEDGNLDVEYLNQLGRNPAQDIQRANPFYGWWIEEKVDYEKTHNSLKDGHYLNIVNNQYTLTGFSYNSQIHNDYFHTWGQVFSYGLSAKNLDGSGSTVIEGVTTDEFEKLLNAWILKKANGIQIEQDNIDAIKEKITAAQNELTTKKQEVLQKQDEVNKYIENINSQYQEAKDTLDQTQQKFDEISQQKTEKQKELTQANKDVDDAVQGLSKANQNYRQISDKKSLESSIKQSQTSLEAYQDMYKRLTAPKEEIQKQIDDVSNEIDKTQSAIDEKQEEMDDVNTLIAENQKEVDDYTAELSKLSNEATSKTAQKDQTTAKIEELTKETENYNKSLQDYETAKENYDNASKILSNTKASFEQTQKELDALESKIEGTLIQLGIANKENDKVQKAQAQWDSIKAGANIEFGPFDDTVLDGLKDIVDTYIQTRKLSTTLEDALTNAQADFELADQKAEEALEAYEKADAEYNQAKAELDAFNEKYGVVTVDTIIMPTQAEYTGKQIIPGVFVKDSKGNTVDPNEYTITYGENVEIGTGTVTITMNGENYVGTFTKTFEIVDKIIDNNTGGNNGNTNSSTTNSSNLTNESNNNNKQSTSNSKNTVKTGDNSKNVSQLGAISIISLLLYSLIKRKDNKEETA